MKCLYCTTELPVDGNTKKITCPKCGSEQHIPLKLSGNTLILPINPVTGECDPFFDSEGSNDQHYGIDERGDRRENY